MRIIGILAVGLTALVLIGCGASAHKVTGTVSAPDCAKGYNLEHADVKIRNEKNDIIAATTTSSNTTNSYRCEVTFKASVPDAKFYQVTIGTHGAPSYSHSDMERKKWTLGLSLD